MRFFPVFIILLFIVVGQSSGQSKTDTTKTDTTTVNQKEDIPFFQRIFPFLGGNKKKNKSSKKNGQKEERVNVYEDYDQQKIDRLFFQASLDGDTELMERLLDEGAIIDTKNRHGRTPLIEAARRGNYEVAKFLIENGANINTRDNYDATALTYASRSGNSRIANLLLNYGAR